MAAVGLQAQMDHGRHLGADCLLQLILGLGHCIFVRLQPCQPGGSEADVLGAGIARVVGALHHAPGLALVYQGGHGLFGHAGAGGKVGEAAALEFEVPGDVNMGCPDLPAGSEVGQTQGCCGVPSHELEDSGIKALQRQPQPMTDVVAAPGFERGENRHGVNGNAN